MSKTKDELLLDYKKSNKERRLNIIVKAGFSTEAEYLTYLMQAGEVTPEPVSGVKPTIHNVYIIDVSSSMNDHNKIGVAIAGVNAELQALKNDPNANYLQTIVEFSDPHKIKVAVDRVPLDKVGQYYTIANGWTALYKAIGETLERMKGLKQAGEAVLVKIFTDGEENKSHGSKYANKAVLSQLIKDCEDDSFTITFVGTERDVKSVIDNLGVDESNTWVHQNDARSVGETFFLASTATMDYSEKLRGGKSVKRGFYKKLKD